MDKAQTLSPDALGFQAFELVRKHGPQNASGEVITHNGRSFELGVAHVCNVNALLLTLRPANGKPHAGEPPAFVMVDACPSGPYWASGFNLATKAMATGREVAHADIGGHVIPGRIYRLIPYTSDLAIHADASPAHGPI